MSNTTFLVEPEPLDREQSIESYLKSRLQSLDRLIGGTGEVSLSGLSGNVDLTPTQAKYAVIVLKDNPSAAATVRIPATTGAIAAPVIVNKCGGSFPNITVKSTGANTGNSAGVSVPTGYARVVRHDGESVYLVTSLVSTTTGMGLAARVYNSANISIANGTVVYFTFDSERRDDGSLHSTSSNTDRLTVPIDGWYIVFGCLEYASNAVGYRSTFISKNAGATIIVATTTPAVSGSTTIHNPTALAYLVAGDYVRFGTFQTSGGALNGLASTEYSIEFGIVKVG